MLQSADDGTVRLSVRLTPKASANRIQGTGQSPDGTSHLKVQVTTVPENGKANAALIKLLAKALKCPKTSLTIISGATDRNKVVAISGGIQDLDARLQAILTSH